MPWSVRWPISHLPTYLAYTQSPPSDLSMNSQPPPECISGMDVEKSFEGSDGKDLDSVDHLTSEETDLVYDSGWSAWLTLAGG